jgi:hypothetical protein
LSGGIALLRTQTLGPRALLRGAARRWHTSYQRIGTRIDPWPPAAPSHPGNLPTVKFRRQLLL